MTRPARRGPAWLTDLVVPIVGAVLVGGFAYGLILAMSALPI